MPTVLDRFVRVSCSYTNSHAHIYVSLVVSDFVEKYVHFRDAVHRLGVMDCLCSLAVLARNPTYTRPVFTEQQQV